MIKDVENSDEIVAHIDPDIKLKHSISLFGIVAKKIHERG